MQFFTIHWSVIMTTRYMYRNILIFRYKRTASFFTFPQLAQFHFLSWRVFVSSIGAFSFPQLAHFRFPSWRIFVSLVGAIRGGQRQNEGAFWENFYKEEGGRL